MEFDEVVEKRRSVRSFKDKKVKWDDVLEAIDAANKAPFAGNVDHLKFVIIEDATMIGKIANFCQQEWVADVGIVVVVCSDNRRLISLYDERGKIYSRQEAGAAIQNLLLKLTDLGLSGCWIGAYADELLEQLLGVPNHIRIEAVIPIGYEKLKTKAPRKTALQNIIYWGKWNVSKRPAGIKEPDTR